MWAWPNFARPKITCASLSLPKFWSDVRNLSQFWCPFWAYQWRLVRHQWLWSNKLLFQWCGWGRHLWGRTTTNKNYSRECFLFGLYVVDFWSIPLIWSQSVRTGRLHCDRSPNHQCTRIVLFDKISYILWNLLFLQLYNFTKFLVAKSNFSIPASTRQKRDFLWTRARHGPMV